MIDASWTRWARRVAKAFGLVLVLSAVLKAASPARSASLLAWSGAAVPLRYAIVGVLGAVEALIGAGIVLGPWPAAACASGAVLAAALLAGHLTLVETGQACGCFGDLAIPEWALRAVLVIGGTACLLGARSKPDPPVPARHPRVRALAVVAIAAATWIPGLARGGLVGATDELPRVLGAHPENLDALVVVGATSCPDCLAMLTRLEAAYPDLAVWLLTRDRDSAGLDIPARVVRRAIADDLWWGLIDGSPPAVFRVRGGRVARW